MKNIDFSILKRRAVELRRSGLSYGEIREVLKSSIAKSTLSYWCKDVQLDPNHTIRIAKLSRKNLDHYRELALAVNRVKRKKYLKNIFRQVQNLAQLFNNRKASKAILGVLYWCEGSGTRRGALTFGNSNPDIICLFLSLLRQCYLINEEKFRCTVQCRADQSVGELQRYWRRITGIPSKQFYKAQVDPRTIGKVSRKPNYKGVCRIDYFSADVYNELKIIQNVLANKGS